jgi:transcriptional antiterminator Rof (Rho-off)
MVNAWVTQGGTTNAGLLIRGRSGTANGQIFFDTNETTDAGAQPAQLVIDYTPAAQTAYQIWVQANTLTGADADPTSDPDFDETVNLLEFAIDGNPKSGISSGKMACRVADIAGEPALTFTLPVRNGAVFSGANSLTATKDDVEYIVRASADLSAWTLDVDEVTPALSAGLPALNDGWSYRTFRIAGPVSLRPKAYFQLGVNYVP